MECSDNDNPSHHKKSNSGLELHAHFVEPDDDHGSHDSKIVVERSGENVINVRLGFLQYKHVYEVRFCIEDDLGEDLIFDQLENLSVKVESANPSEDGQGHDIVLLFSASKEKLMRESVTLTSKEDKSKKITLSIFSRVLGKGKGTPALKEGIHCVRIDWDEDSDTSDWQGF